MLDLAIPSAPVQPSQVVDFADHELTATVRHVKHVSDEGWAALVLDEGRTATGDVDEGQEFVAGVAYRFFGAWTQHEKFGAQFKFESYTLADKQNHVGVVTYLARSKLGISPAAANRLWNAYGPDAIRTLREQPETVFIDGIIPERLAQEASRLLRAAVENEPLKIALFALFASRGFPRGVVTACIEKWGPNAPAIIRKDPFRLIVEDVPGVGFKRADKLFLDLGGNPLRLKRQTLAAWHYLHTSTSGNTWETENGMFRAILDAVGSFENGDFDKAVRLGVRAGWISKRAGTYAERENAMSEERLARHIKRVLGHATCFPALAAGENGIDQHQAETAARITGSALGIIAGSPGTGKTFVAAALLKKLLETMPAGKIAVCAPTGKAAVRITEACGRYGLPLQATTIHRMLGVGGLSRGKWQFGRNELSPVEARVVVVDEFSMCDTDLAASLFAAIPPGGNVLIVGDPYQLPPVGHGAPLRDMIAAHVPTGLLTEIKRNSGGIVRACADIKDGAPFSTSTKIDEAAGVNLISIPADSPEDQAGTLANLLRALKANMGIDPIWDVQVLVATNDKSKISRKSLNVMLQDQFNPQVDGIKADLLNPEFRPGDKVICLKNNEIKSVEMADGATPADMASYCSSPRLVYLANGDMGRVEAVDKTSAVVRFMLPDRLVKIVTAKKKKKAEEGAAPDDKASAAAVEFDRAYAITVHKSQGSEWPIVVVMIDENAGRIGCREWIYTAISRAKRLCFLVGKINVAMRQSMRVNLEARRTFLKELLEGK